MNQPMGDFSHSKGCTNLDSIYVPDRIKDKYPNKSTAQLVNIYNKEKETKVALAGAVILRNKVALPFPGSSSGSIIKGLTQIAGTIVATSLVVDSANKNRVKEGTIIYRSSVSVNSKASN